MAGKSYYYVLVCTEDGPRFVTKTENRMAYWNEDEAPKPLTEPIANDVVIGLSWSGFIAYVIKSKIKIESNPYNYKNYEIKFVKKGSEE